MIDLWRWLRGNVGKVLAVVAALLGGWLAWGAYRRKVGGLAAAVGLQRALGEVRGLQAKREALRARAKQAGDAGKRIDIEDARLTLAIRDAKKRAVDVVEETEGLSNAEVVRRFNALLTQ